MRHGRGGVERSRLGIGGALAVDVGSGVEEEGRARALSVRDQRRRDVDAVVGQARLVGVAGEEADRGVPVEGREDLGIDGVGLSKIRLKSPNFIYRSSKIV